MHDSIAFCYIVTEKPCGTLEISTVLLYRIVEVYDFYSKLLVCMDICLDLKLTYL